MVDFTILDVSNSAHVSWLYEVRTHPEVASHFFAPPPATHSNHLNFLQKAVASGEREFFIIHTETVFVGYCQIIYDPESFEIGLALHPDFQGRGYGFETIKFLISYLSNKNRFSMHAINLVVKKSNLRAIRLYKKCGFEIVIVSGEKIVMQYLGLK